MNKKVLCIEKRQIILIYNPKLVTGAGLCEVNKMADALSMSITLGSGTEGQLSPKILSRHTILCYVSQFAASIHHVAFLKTLRKVLEIKL